MKFDLIKQFVEEKISGDEFFNVFYNDVELQKQLEKETDIKPFTNCGSLFLFLATGNKNLSLFILESKEALEKYLSKNNIQFTQSNELDKLYSAISNSMPKWLNVSLDYFIDKIDNNKSNPKELKEQIKKIIERDFISLKNKPKWLQAPNWPIENGKPLIFIGEQDMSEISHDTTKVYVFFNRTGNSFTCVKQSM